MSIILIGDGRVISGVTKGGIASVDGPALGSRDGGCDVAACVWEWLATLDVRTNALLPVAHSLEFRVHGMWEETDSALVRGAAVQLATLEPVEVLDEPDE